MSNLEIKILEEAMKRIRRRANGNGLINKKQAMVEISFIRIGHSDAEKVLDQLEKKKMIRRKQRGRIYIDF